MLAGANRAGFEPRRGVGCFLGVPPIERGAMKDRYVARPTARLKSGAEQRWQMAPISARRDFRPTGFWPHRDLRPTKVFVLPCQDFA
jgi:hypothetical protein